MRHSHFDTLILADVIFNHSEQEKLLATVLQTLRKSEDAKALVFFTPHRPWLLHKDFDFFEKARKAGLGVEKAGEWLMERPMFDDRGVSLATSIDPVFREQKAVNKR